MVYLAYDTVEMEERADGKKRITLSVLPRDKGTPAGTPGWAVFLQVVLVALTITSVVRPRACGPRARCVRHAVPREWTEAISWCSHGHMAAAAHQSLTRSMGLCPCPSAWGTS